MNVISSSYGNDSVAMMQWAYESELADVTVAYCDTGWASPTWANRVIEGERLARKFGFNTEHIKSIGMEQLVRDRKGFPGNGMQFWKVVEDTAKLVVKALNEDKDFDAFSLVDGFDDPDERVYCWTFLDSKQRARLKAQQEVAKETQRKAEAQEWKQTVGAA